VIGVAFITISGWRGEMIYVRGVALKQPPFKASDRGCVSCRPWEL
jgi:hypothetical protein